MIYVDNAATAKMPQAVKNELVAVLEANHGNPSSPNQAGINAKNALNAARKHIAAAIGASENEIVFTSGGSEANNQAVLTIKRLGQKEGKNKIIISEIEHDSLYNAAKALEKNGFKVITVGISKQGFVSAEEIKRLIDNTVCAVSIMTANNEIGTIQPIAEIGEFCRKTGVLFHTDAVQAVGHIDIDVRALGVDMLSLSAHKFGGLKGVGALYVRNGITPKSLIVGGNQESGFRAGTENVAGIAAMAKALELSLENLAEKQKSLEIMRNRLAEKLLVIADVRINGALENRLHGNLNISFKNIDSEALLLMLDGAGICASAGAACHTGIQQPSRTITALGVPKSYALGTIRFSLSTENTLSEIDYIAETVINSVNKLR